MTKKLLLVLTLATLGLTGCVAVPYDAPYAYGPAVVAPSVSFGYYGGYYGGHGGHRGYRGHRY